MGIIQRLPEALVNQIAAGEVVERPASVVKELCENALDAGATHLQVDLEEGGLRLIQIVDDGSGMGPEDARLCLERHATSKLRDQEGLARIATMGFRGEALPAIASVSHFTLTTRPKDALAATRLRVDGGGSATVEEAGAPVGTRLEVADLFYNTPARRKFLKRPQTEGSHCAEVVSRLLLARNDVGFTLVSNGRRLLTSPPGAPLRERLALALGREVFDHLVEVDWSQGELEIRGYVASPDYSAATAQKIQLFVNGRAIRDRSVSHAVTRAYANLLPPGRYPAAALFLSLPLDQVDVNVHPQKLEVRFSEPRAIHDAFSRALGQTLRPAPWLGASGSPPPEAPRASIGSWPRALGGPATFPRATEAEALFTVSEGFGSSDAAPAILGPALARPGYFSALRILGQLARSYLVCEGGDGALVVLDQHAAHERVLFERLREGFASKALASQRLLLPAIVELGAAQSEALLAHRDRLPPLGFEAEPFGGESWSVVAVPALLTRASPGLLFRDLAEQLVQLGAADAAEDALNDALATMACHSAVRAQDPLSPDELRALLVALDSIDFKVRCPHGRPVVTEISLAELERRVERR